MNNKLKIKIDPRAQLKLDAYPPNVRRKLLNLRRIILETAQKIEAIKEVEETLKWGEPSYLVKKGSTIRINWKKSKPEQYAIYFKCTSKLVPTFKAIYKEKFNYEGNRAIVFKLEENIPEEELKHCVSLALTYHSVKHLPLLGWLKLN